MGPDWKQLAVALGIVAVLAGAGWLVETGIDHGERAALRSACSGVATEDQQADCLFKFVDRKVEHGDLRGAFMTLAAAYTEFETISRRCHVHAHRIGDSAYYRYYLIKGIDIRDMDFPQETTSCGYGFFHGFLEHLIQDRPDPAYAMEVCQALHEQYHSTMSNIRVICYHGTGHGYAIAHALTVPKSDWGNVRAFVDAPVAKCDAMTRASESEREDCRQGVFNVLILWMEDEDFGFSYDEGRPFAVCNEGSPHTQHACTYEMAQRLSGVADNDMVLVDQLASQAATPELVDVAFLVGTAGVIQQTISDGRGYEPVLAGCSALSDARFRDCVEGIVWGLYEHGLPQQEFAKVLDFCAEDEVAARDEASFCYRKAAERLPRFYTNERIRRICASFPSAYAHLCTVPKR